MPLDSASRFWHPKERNCRALDIGIPVAKAVEFEISAQRAEAAILIRISLNPNPQLNIPLMAIHVTWKSQTAPDFVTF